jgi:hypothetical protein
MGRGSFERASSSSRERPYSIGTPRARLHAVAFRTAKGLKLGNGRGPGETADKNTGDLSHLEAGSAVLLVEDESMVAYDG